MKIAAIDVGTNSIHMIVANVRPDLSFEVIDREKEMVRLGAGGLGGRALSDAAMMPALRVLAKFKRLIDSLGVDEIRATATSAIREAPNGGAFLAALERQTGIRARVITGAREARLLHQAAMYGVDAAGGRAVVIDIGGGSTEITLGTAAAVELSRSFLLGSIRLTERFVKSDPLEAGDERRLVKHIRTRVDAFLDEVKEAGFDRVIGTSGTMLALAGVAFAAGGVALPGGLHHRSLTADDLHRTRKMLVSLSLSKRLRLPGLDPPPRRPDRRRRRAARHDRPAARRRRRSRCATSPLREGLVLDYIRRQPASRSPGSSGIPTSGAAASSSWPSAAATRPEHAQQVARLALSLFDQTRSVARAHRPRARVARVRGAAARHRRRTSATRGHHSTRTTSSRTATCAASSPTRSRSSRLIARYHRRGDAEEVARGVRRRCAPAARTRSVRTLAAILRARRGPRPQPRAGAWTGSSSTIGGDARSSLVVRAARRRRAGALGRRAPARAAREGHRASHIRVETAGGSHAEQPDHAAPIPGQAVRRRRHRRLGQDDAARAAGEVADRGGPPRVRHRVELVGARQGGHEEPARRRTRSRR